MRFVVVALALCSCTQLYGLDDTRVVEAPPLPDLDGDGIEDLADNCFGVANSDQRDRDADGFGDACDFCPDLKSTSNHDEDADSRGDACDLCPTVPDFQMDQDKDQVGDACDNDFASRNTRLLFDPLQTLDAYWQPTGMWSLLGDSVAPVDAGAMLHAPMLEVAGDANASFEVLLGVTQTAPLQDGDRFEIQLLDGNGAVVVGCRVQCMTQFGCVLSDLSGLSSQQVPANRPLDELAFRRNPIGQYCVYSGDGTSIPVMPFSRGSVRLVGTPRVQFRYLSVTQ